MELALSLGDAPKPFSFLENPTKTLPANNNNKDPLGFNIALYEEEAGKSSEYERRGSSDPPLIQLDLLPSTPVLRSHHLRNIPWLNDALGMERVTTTEVPAARALDVNRFRLPATEDTDDGASLSSPNNSAVSSFQMDFSITNGGNADAVARNYRREHKRAEGADRGSDDEDNGSTRKKLRLSKEQSAFLEESFKEHTTLNPKQKLALAKQLNLRPRQVEVWFQNRRARTKLKQTEVDCEYLKRCCETLTEENRRLQKELQELRALKTSQPFYKQLPATTLTMCPSCERVATNTTGTVAASNQTTTVTVAATNNNNNNGSKVSAALSLGKPIMLPFPNGQAHLQQAQKAHKIAS